jgi:hypothetical protein
MGPEGDLQGDMTRYPWDDATVERLLGGTLAPDDTPPELRQVAALVGAARRGPEGTELEGAGLAAATFAAACVQGAGALHPRRRPMISKLASAKLLAIAAPVALLGAGTAAAATNSLPAPAQAAASRVLAHLDVSVPNPDSASNPKTDQGTANGKGPDASATSPATFGLCTAYTAGGLQNHNSPPYRNLLAAAGSGGIASYCKTVIADHNSAVNGHTANPGTNGGANNGGAGGAPTGGNANSGSGSEGTGDNGSSGTTGGPPFSTPPAGKPSGVPAAGR